jgi:hypothetical protein
MPSGCIPLGAHGSLHPYTFTRWRVLPLPEHPRALDAGYLSRGNQGERDER